MIKMILRKITMVVQQSYTDDGNALTVKPTNIFSGRLPLFLCPETLSLKLLPYE